MSNHDSHSSLEKRLAKYGAMSLAVASGVLANPAHASLIVTSAGAACSGNNSTTGGAVYFNGLTGACGHSSVGALFKLEKIVGFSGTIMLRAVGMTSFAQVAGNAASIFKLPTNATAAFSGGSFLGGALEIRDSGGAHSGLWNTGDDDFIGLLNSPSGFHYGWAELQITGYDATLVQFAYNTGGGPAPSTAPEPSSMALLALGAAGVGIYRRRKAKPV